jgi:hypothetical protein
MKSTIAALLLVMLTLPGPGFVHGQESGPDLAARPVRTPSVVATGQEQATPDTTPTTESEQCGMVAQQFYSPARNKDTTYLAFVPPQSENGQLFPVFYLLHGAWDGYQAWNEHAHSELSQLSRQHGLIIVTPDGDEFGWYADSALDPANRIETYLIHELLPHVQKNLPANDHYGIGGLSMGGHGAFVLTLRHPGLFKSVSSMSGILDLTRHTDNWELPRVFGPFNSDNQETWFSHSAVHLAQRYPDRLKGLPLLITVSTGDPHSLEDNRLFARTLTSLGIKHRYEEKPGLHDWTYWMSQLPEHVAFHAQSLK